MCAADWSCPGLSTGGLNSIRLCRPPHMECAPLHRNSTGNTASLFSPFPIQLTGQRVISTGCNKENTGDKAGWPTGARAKKMVLRVWRS